MSTDHTASRALAETLPVPFGDKYQARLAKSTTMGTDGDECVLCGRRTGGKKGTKFFRVVDGGSFFAHPDDEGVIPEGDMGFFPVGSECAKNLPAEWAQDGGAFE